MHVRVESSHAEQRVEERNVSETVGTSRPPPPGRREAITGLLSFKLRDSARPATHINGKGRTWPCPLPECRHNASECTSNECVG